MNVFLISKPLIDWKQFDKFQNSEGVDWKFYGEGGLTPITNDSQFLVELCGRLCYMSYGRGRKTTEEYIENLRKQGHFSVFEHANWTLFITGVSRSLTHELVRHRHFSYSQLSQRYVDHSNYPIHLPKEIEENKSLKEMWDTAIGMMKEAYSLTLSTFRNENAVTLKKKELHTVARAILPNAIETKIAVTGNARAWRDFIKTRNVDGADPEIRELSIRIRDLLINEAPFLFRDLKEQEVTANV